MLFPLNIVVAVVISAIHVLISFGLKLPSKYKKKLRIYSVVVNLIFIVFLLGFSLFFKTSLPNQGITFTLMVYLHCIFCYLSLWEQF